MKQVHRLMDGAKNQKYAQRQQAVPAALVLLYAHACFRDK